MDRRNFLRHIAGAVGAAPFTLAAKDPRPNIVLMMADDMGFSDIGCYGSEIATPNLDQLGRNGLRFTQFYNMARCCPTRASLLTGLYPHQAGVGHMVVDHGYPSYQGFLNDRCVTIAEVLKPAGYRTAMAGKWHVGEDRPHWPTDRGFEKYFGLINGASSYFQLDEGRTMAMDDQPFTPPAKGFYMTDAFTDKAVEFVDTFGRQDQPFFLYLAFTSPHWPLHARPEDIAKYRGKYKEGWDKLRERRLKNMQEMGLVKKSWGISPRDEKAPSWEDEKDKDQRDLAMSVYAAQIDRMDQNIGRLVSKLKELGIMDNTLILFLADNGGCAEEVHRGKQGAETGTADSYESYGLPWANASNTPFRTFKHWVHEGGISTPLIAHWPKGIASKGKLNHDPGHLVDVMATCVEVSKANYPSTFGGKPIQAMDGESLVPIFKTGKRPERKPIFWEHEGNRAVRQGKWKIVSKFRAGWELYDIDADRNELTNLAAKQVDRVKKMADLYEEWATRAGVVSYEKLIPAGKKKGSA